MFCPAPVRSRPAPRRSPGHAKGPPIAGRLLRDGILRGGGGRLARTGRRGRPASGDRFRRLVTDASRASWAAAGCVPDGPCALPESTARRAGPCGRSVRVLAVPGQRRGRAVRFVIVGRATGLRSRCTGVDPGPGSGTAVCRMPFHVKPRMPEASAARGLEVRSCLRLPVGCHGGFCCPASRGAFMASSPVRVRPRALDVARDVTSKCVGTAVEGARGAGFGPLAGPGVRRGNGPGDGPVVGPLVGSAIGSGGAYGHAGRDVRGAARGGARCVRQRAAGAAAGCGRRSVVPVLPRGLPPGSAPDCGASGCRGACAVGLTRHGRCCARGGGRPGWPGRRQRCRGARGHRTGPWTTAGRRRCGGRGRWGRPRAPRRGCAA